ncbi:chondroitin sulfate proteoglycan 4 isoform X3 [Acanthopagrus latus]|nr:chondroitin sulfate proteoglycan 4 isoform X3 [Acanthopagrus latus]XP_036963774.1 chondroitin sulfate proteoglycan 4 isoform X3 [Acanthopagrus latus]XP_036963775.1 chondroitin sulfate proteoglycan 4 isoform X3 [Acanthopagrus latus]XP_036963776.1 chondroitin sulfate proteoglycan 4 isoform X3 [Acanthopagrus latus]XP_036963777.1 chondroitin sulfate proteoglycan 4 isoform X3 [Acanthopagrus latus]XP_036963778.1 chondroitin sulfate proteoglycan 4 isoform X3 [Acanthopagrus latus]XP_036963779.1 ch
MEDYLFLELQNGKVQARMNMGSGEVILTSSQGVQLNNLLDHKISLTLQDGKLTMTIDELYPTYVPVVDDGEELNIDQGIWLGGTGDLDTPYLSNAIPPFRGCMTQVKFESHQFDILGMLFKQCQDTKESCSSEFEAGDGEATSFSTPDSFVSFPTWSGASGAPRVLEFLMKTTIEDALLIFHPGRESDFIAVGVVKGFLRGMLDLGGGAEVLDNTQVQLDDDQWHRVKVQISEESFVINVDSQSSSLPLDKSQKLDLVGNLYLGGIQGKMKDVFRESGSLNRAEEEMTAESFIGCLGEIKVNQKDRSLQDALVTKDVHVKCEGEDYDYSSYYDTESTTTSPPVRIRYVNMDFNEQHCHPTDDTPEIFKNVGRLLDITPLLVPEGGEDFLDISHIKPTFDLSAAGIRQSEIIFSLQNDPWYGLVDINTNTRRTQKFTLLDVVNKKIKYMHDGNERQADQIQLDVVVNTNSNLPECLKIPREYVVPIEILPVNDIPQLGGGEITITENGRTRLSPTLIKIMDSDTRCDEIVVTVTSEPSIEVGYLENGQHPGRSISEFTCRELKDGNIYFVHRGGSAAEITLEVSDGQSVSHSTSFKLSVTPPHMTVVTNIGLVLTQGSNASIGVQNLAVIAHPRNGDIIYNITQPLMFGELQVMTSGGTYKQVTTFHQSDLDRNSLRYVSTDSSDQEDIVVERIEFSVHLGQFSLWNNTFIVKINPAQVKVSNLVALEMQAGEQQTIKPTELQAEVNGKNPDPQTVKYILVKPPTLGSLKLSDREMAEGDIFTQRDIMDNTVSYKVRVQRAVQSTDQFQFRVLADEQYSPLYTFPINILGNAHAPVLTNERLVVLQGGEETLNKNYLWMQSSGSTDYVYQIIQQPKHGRLIRDSPPGQPRFEGAIRVFSNEDLELDRLIYKHDGSKTSSDEFHFSTFDQAAEDSDNQERVDGIFRIAIQSKNEHAPVRVVDKVFNVVRHGQRLLTTDVIQFKDEDSGFNDTQIVYAREGILSGNIVSRSNPSQSLFRFTQADLRDKNVLFIHHGADRERFHLQVSDGFHKTTALLQIQAGVPYLQVVNNTIIVIDHGSTKTLNTTLLSAESNLDIRDDSEIKFQVTSPPSDGRIIVSGIEASAFTQEDLKKGVVSYEHNYESLRSKDSFGFTVQARGYSEKGTFRIKIFKQGYFSEPEVITNEVIISYEGEHTVITQDNLKSAFLSDVDQADIVPTEMVFTIKEPPRLGHVVKMTNSSDSTASPVLDYIHTFTQEDVDQGRILYVSASVQGNDAFTVDVSNGFTTVEDLRLSVNIVPRIIPLQTLNFTVKEGLSRAVNAQIVNISHPFYSSANIDFIVEESPQHGDLRYVDGDELTYFTWDEMKRGQIFYMHDSTESTEDSFTLSATAYEIGRRSLPVTISVTVIPVNDEPPKLTRNTGLEVLAGEEADITSSMLNADDEDTPAEELVYNVEGPTNGMVALKEAPEEGIFNFTQSHINRGEVIFIHEGEESGGFSFTVTDGEHTSPLYRFVVTARPLTITMVTQEELMVFPGTRQPITSANLGAVTNEDGNEISYSLIRPPRLGRLILANDKNQYEEITRFTQSQLESGAVFYEHQIPEDPFWVARDSIELSLSSQPAPDVRHILPITVSYYAAHSNISTQLWENKGLDMVQGQMKVIDESILDASNLLASLPEAQRGDADVIFEIKRFPDHGRITLNGQDLPRNAPFFMQKDLAQGNLEYSHDDSGASFDSFSFRARLKSDDRGVASPAEAVVLEEIFNISVKRRGSDPPELVTIDMLLEVLQGSMTILTQKHLNTQDEDSPPDEVHFKVTKAPRNGRLVNLLTMDPISEFTQEMVNRGQVGFYSDGSLADGFVEFIVSDGGHQTEPHTLHIGVLARTLLLDKAPEIKVKQGDDETLVTEEMLKATTGGPVEEDILYKITSVPKYAAVMVDRQPTSAFTQKQIKEGRVSVRFVKSTSPRDSVSFVARSRAANVSSVLNITVQPLANIAQDPLLPQGALVQLDRKLLDSTPLANKTRTSPTFTVIQQPQGARFVRSGSPGAGQPVDVFSQKDLDEGRVAMEILDNSGSRGGVTQDEARFLLKAHGVPPAECVLSFQTGPYNASGVYPATLLRTPSKDSNELPVVSGIPRVTPASPRWRGKDVPTTTSSGTPQISRPSNIWSILIPILVILLLLLLAAILAYYLIRKNKTGKHNVQTAAIKPKNGEVAGTETFRKTDPANNIPMSNMDSKDADPELLQHCRTTNPALKKNQYWV